MFSNSESTCLSTWSYLWTPLDCFCSLKCGFSRSSAIRVAGEAVTSWIHFGLIFTQAFQLYFFCYDKNPQKSQSSGEEVGFSLQFQAIVLGGAVKVEVS